MRAADGTVLLDYDRQVAALRESASRNEDGDGLRLLAGLTALACSISGLI